MYVDAATKVEVRELVSVGQHFGHGMYPSTVTLEFTTSRLERISSVQVP